MGEKNIFALALSFSLAWHLVGGEAVHIIWPEKLAERKFPEINFWGSLLEAHRFEPKDINFGSEIKNGQPVGETVKNNQTDIEFNLLKKEILPVSELSEKKDPVIEINTASLAEFSISESIKGELKRSVLVKPALPVYPEWAKELGNYFEIELKFLILPDGTVGSVDKVTSAGYPELDEIGIRYIRKWKFMPLPEGSKSLEQWGIIKLVFNLK
ncbi:MAG: energy transducer TonB [Candidatus Omnitrophota bacterium]